MPREKDYPDVFLARSLKELCAERNIKQGDLAAVCYKERKTANSWINCVTSPSAYDLKKICLKYNLSADELMGLKGKQYGSQ